MKAINENTKIILAASDIDHLSRFEQEDMPQHFKIKSAFIEKGLERKGLGLFLIVKKTN